MRDKKRERQIKVREGNDKQYIYVLVTQQCNIHVLHTSTLGSRGSRVALWKERRFPRDDRILRSFSICKTDNDIHGVPIVPILSPYSLGSVIFEAANGCHDGF